MADIETAKMVKEVVGDAMFDFFKRRRSSQQSCNIIGGVPSRVAKAKHASVPLSDLKYVEVDDSREENGRIHATFVGEVEGVRYAIGCRAEATLGEVLLPYLMSL